MTWELPVLCLSALVAGAVNSVAGGGTLLTFPALIAALGGSEEASVLANATSTIALFPGSLAGLWGYRRELEGMGHWVRLLIVPSFIGGILGALLVVLLPPSTFKMLVPWLILVATSLLAFQPAIARWTGIGKPHEQPSGGMIAGLILGQFAIAVYGGYFGAGIGILMLSALAMMGLSDIHRMNALKALFAVVINGIAVVVFLQQDKVQWQFAGPMIATSVVGGYLGAHYARKLDKTLVRRFIVAIGFNLAAWYFVKTYLLDTGTKSPPAATQNPPTADAAQ